MSTFNPEYNERTNSQQEVSVTSLMPREIKKKTENLDPAGGDLHDNTRQSGAGIPRWFPSEILRHADKDSKGFFRSGHDEMTETVE